jgi:hypothetical protein
MFLLSENSLYSSVNCQQLIIILLCSVGKKWAAIQKRGSILEWIVILSVYDADTIAFDLSLSALIS